MTVNRSSRPVIGVTMGDAAGIGPEVVLRALESKPLRNAFRCMIIGDAAHLGRLAISLGAGPDLVPYESETGAFSGSVEVFDLANLPPEVETGVDAPSTGKASGEYLVAAVQLWKQGVIDAIATAPISKKAIAMGGFDYPGHTEFLADLSGTSQFAMSFFAQKLRVVLMSTHLPLVEAISLITEERLVDLIKFTHREIGRLLSKDVSIAVAGLNPHASEGGMFGSEELDVIGPAVKRCQHDRINVSGPYSPDSIFLRGFQGEYDACIALYHDQATIAVKALSFGSGVNVTLGLPFIRTSVDHGTAFDIVNTGTADASSMLAAIQLAGDLVNQSRSRI
ncbi:4-hydroxythreonine-4-phosphate dehydrogenase PdxA [soil metagenome]